MKRIIETLHEMALALGMFCLTAFFFWPPMFLYEMIFIGLMFYLIVKFLYFAAERLTNSFRRKEDE